MHPQVLDFFVVTFFVAEMLGKMVFFISFTMHLQVSDSFVAEMLGRMFPMGFYGYKGSYLCNPWNRLDLLINLGE